MARYGYARVSTEKQRHSLPIQVKRLEDSGCDRVIVEVASAVTCAPRQSLESLIEMLRPGDCIVVDGMSRLSRNIEHGTSLARRIFDAGAVIEDLGTIGFYRGDVVGEVEEATLAVAFLPGYLDAKWCANDAAEGIAVAKAAGRYAGRKPIDIDPGALAAARAAVDAGTATVAGVCSQLGISRSTWYRMLRAA